jgi:hypothetical protein
MTVDEATVTPQTDGTGSKLTVFYVPADALEEEADHDVAIKVQDAKGTTGEKEWTFHIGDTYSR